jgi:UPF0755 protein
MTGKKIFVVFILVFSILLASFGFYGYQMVTTPNFLVDQNQDYIHIPTGATFKDVQNIMYEGNYVRDLVSFSTLAKWKNLDKNIKPGRYLLKPNMNNWQVIKLLQSGQQSPTNITFNNVRLKEDLAEKICKNIEIEPDSFLELLNDAELAKSYGFNEESFLSMFIPNTYEVYWTVKPEELIDRMNKEYKKFWNDERIAKAKQLDMTPIEVSVLASIVMAESVKSDESPVIAGVYINRLRKGIPLQADPTLVYAAGDFTIRRVLNMHKEIDSPYNTYKYAGLPPGPINLPSITAIDAVLNYKEHKYLYFCAKEDFSGYHNFAATLTEHLNNAKRYQAALNKARVFN